MKELVILRTRDSIFKPYKADEHTLAVASHYLQYESVKEIKDSLKYAQTQWVNPTSPPIELAPQASRSNLTLYYDKESIIVRYNIIPEWQVVILAHTLRCSLEADLKKTFLSIADYFSKIYKDYNKYNMMILKSKHMLDEYRKEHSLIQTPFFNIKKMLASLKRKRIKSWIHNGNIICEFNNVKLGSEEEGYIIYNIIFLVLNGYSIDGFLFRFKEFDYSSYWNLPVTLHPKLWLPISFSSDTTDFINTDSYAMSLKRLVKEYDKNDARCFKKIPEIIDDFQQRRRLWASNRFLVHDRIHLSKMIFNEAIRYK